MLDYGTGSGVLGIGALKLGAARAVATDVEAYAVRAAASNAELNGVGARFEVGDFLWYIRSRGLLRWKLWRTPGPECAAMQWHSMDMNMIEFNARSLAVLTEYWCIASIDAFLG